MIYLYCSFIILFHHTYFIILVNVGAHASYTGGYNLLANQFFAMLMKKFLSMYRSWVLLIIQILMPVLFLIIAMIVMRTSQATGNLPALAMDLNRFDNPITVVGNVSNSIYAETYLDVLKDLNYHAEMTNNVTNRMLNLVGLLISQCCQNLIVKKKGLWRIKTLLKIILVFREINNCEKKAIKVLGRNLLQLVVVSKDLQAY